MKARTDSTARTIQAGVLAWLLPGAGHYYLGHRGFAAVFFVAISFAYGTGLAIGGVKTSINPYFNRWLFMAELGTGGYTTAGFLLSNTAGGIDARTTSEILHRGPSFRQLPLDQQRKLEDRLLPYLSFYPQSDVAQIYLAIGGLLNLLAILDAIMRAQTGGKPVFYPEIHGEAAGQGQEAEHA